MAAAATRAPKQWYLGKTETVTTFNAWKDNLLYTLSLDPRFAPFLLADATWAKETTADPNRGFTDEAGHDANPPTGLKKEERLKHLCLFLGQIANHATIISRNQIVGQSTSLKDIWSKLREHYGIQASGSKFIDLSNVKLLPGERHEDLYQRLLAFFEDNLLTVGDTITHHGAAVTSREELTPSLENVVVLLWLERIHIALPGIIKQRYGAELRNKTLASLKSEISQSLDSLLGELRNVDEDSSGSRVMRASVSNASNNRSSRNTSTSRFQQQRSSGRSPPFCCLCHAAKRPSTDHWLSNCRFLPEADRRRFESNRVRLVEVDEDGNEEPLEPYEEEETAGNNAFIDAPVPAMHRRVITRKSPHLKCFINHYPVLVCLDSGAESSLMSKRFANDVGIPIRRATQGAVQADAKSPLDIVGEVSNVSLTRGAHVFNLDALVTDRDFGDIIAGEPFLEKNDVAVRAFKKQIIIRGRDIVPYDNY